MLDANDQPTHKLLQIVRTMSHFEIEEEYSDPGQRKIPNTRNNWRAEICSTDMYRHGQKW